MSAPRGGVWERTRASHPRHCSSPSCLLPHRPALLPVWGKATFPASPKARRAIGAHFDSLVHTREACWRRARVLCHACARSLLEGTGESVHFSDREGASGHEARLEARQGARPTLGHRVSADACCGPPPPFPAALPPLLPRGRNSDSTDRGGAMSGKEQKWITVCGPAPTQPSLASLLSLLGTHPHSKRTTDYLSLRTIPGHRRAGRKIAELQRQKGGGGAGSDKRGC